MFHLSDNTASGKRQQDAPLDAPDDVTSTACALYSQVKVGMLPRDTGRLLVPDPATKFRWPRGFNIPPGTGIRWWTAARVVSVRVTVELLEMLDLHDNLLAGPTGRKVNGADAGALVEYLHFGRIQGIGFLAGAPGSVIKPRKRFGTVRTDYPRPCL
jgi:hypothetical protein